MVRKKHLILLVAAFVIGCASPANDPISQFQKKHPDDAKRYTYIHPSGTDLAEWLLSSDGQLAGTIGHTLKQKFSQTPGVNQIADQLLKRQARKDAFLNELFTTLDRAEKEGGAVCTFKNNKGSGVLVLMQGNITYQKFFILESDSIVDNSGTSATRNIGH